jgi:hypothetical protein
MAVESTFIEHADIHLVLGECRGNSVAAVRRHAEKCPNGRVPNRRTFLCVDQPIRETGTVRRTMVDAGRPRSVRTPVAEENILDIVGGIPV